MMETGEAHGSVTGYFREREEVSALYASLPASPSDGQGVTKIAVLLRDAGLADGELELLVKDYKGAVADIVGGTVAVMVLNSLDPGLRQVVLKTWQLLFDRNRRYLAWFMRATREEADAGAKDGVPGSEPEPVDEVSEALR
jgi:hypothetical protein